MQEISRHEFTPGKRSVPRLLAEKLSAHHCLPRHKDYTPTSAPHPSTSPKGSHTPCISRTSADPQPPPRRTWAYRKRSHLTPNC